MEQSHTNGEVKSEHSEKNGKDTSEPVVEGMTTAATPETAKAAVVTEEVPSTLEELVRKEVLANKLIVLLRF